MTEISGLDPFQRERFNYTISIPYTGVKRMVYKHGEWTLYKRDVKLKGGKWQTIYFFSRRTPKSGKPCDLPDGYEVGVNKRTGLPFLRKKR